MAKEAAAALARISIFRGIDPGDIRIARLGGLTNRSYRVASPVGRFVLRLAGDGAGDHIDRGAEEHNARIAARAGINAEVVFFDAGDGTMLCHSLEGTVPMDAEAFRDLGAVARAAAALRRLHDCDAPFAGRLDPFAAIEAYASGIEARGAVLPDGCREAMEGMAPARAALAARPPAFGPCHGDPVPENFLDAGERMYLVDYEYSGNGDAMWDLAYLSTAGEFDAESDTVLMRAYFGCVPPACDAARASLYKAACDLLSALWAVDRPDDGDVAGALRTYVRARLERCSARVASAEFGRSLDALQRVDRR